MLVIGGWRVQDEENLGKGSKESEVRRQKVKVRSQKSGYGHELR